VEQQQRTAGGACEADAKAFTRCMDDFKGDMNVCSWYLEQLKVILPCRWMIDGSLVNKWRVSISISPLLHVRVDRNSSH